MKYILAALMVISVVFIAGCTSTSQTTKQGSGSTQTTIEPSQSTNTIEITSSGFSPNTLTINKGDTVVWINKDSTQHWPASAFHPTHTVYPGSNIEKCGTWEKIFDACKGLSQGENFTFQFNFNGTWHYHDHLNARLSGTVIVK